jgi:hypothetical protein
VFLDYFWGDGVPQAVFFTWYRLGNFPWFLLGYRGDGVPQVVSFLGLELVGDAPSTIEMKRGSVIFVVRRIQTRRHRYR